MFSLLTRSMHVFTSGLYFTNYFQDLIKCQKKFFPSLSLIFEIKKCNQERLKLRG